MKPICPLCSNQKIGFKFENKRRIFNQCSSCKLIFVPSNYFPDSKSELAHYEMHENSPEDLGYRNFLNQFVNPFKKYINVTMSGLDYGSGPCPTLSVMLGELEFSVENYDPYFLNDISKLSSTYDFVTCTEVVEHFYDPIREFGKLFSLVKPNGVLGVMTQFHNDTTDFKTWYYKEDITHVHFYSRETLEFIATHFNAEINFYGKNVAIFSL